VKRITLPAVGLQQAGGIRRVAKSRRAGLARCG